MSYYVGTQSYPNLYAAIEAAKATNGTVTSQPVSTTSTDGGMLSGTSTSTPSEREYRYVKEPSDLSGGSSRNVWDATKIGVARGDAGLKELYDSRKEYVQLFDSFNNFKSYMNEIQDLYDSEALSPWYKTQSIREWTDAEYGEGTYDEIREEASLAEAYGEQDTGVARLRDDYEAAMAPIREEQFKAFMASSEYQGLAQKYGLNDVVKNQDGDVFAFNGGWPVEVFEVDDHMGAGDYLKVAAAIGLGAWAGPILSTALSSAGMGATTASIVSAAATSAGSQLITTGEIDPARLLQAAATAGLSGAVSELTSSLPTEYLDALSTGNEAVDNILATMAMDVVKQGVIDGQVDLQQVVQSGMFTAAGELIDFLQGNMAVDPAKQAEFEAKWAEMTAEQHQEMFNTIEQTFGSGALTDALNSMDAQTAMMASQTLADMFAANNVTVSQGSDGTWVEEQEVSLTDDTTTQPIYDTPPAQINNPFEGDQLINGVYYNEAGFPVGVHPDATADQILEQFVNDKNAWNTLRGSAHGLPPEAVAILVKASGGTVQGLSDLLVENGLILAQGEGGQYVMISGSNSTTGLHTSLNQDALLELQAPTENNYMPNPQPTNDLLNPTDTSDVSQEMLDILTNVEQQPDIIEPNMSIDPTTVTPDPITPDPVDIVDPVEPPVTTSGDAGATGDAGAGTGITISDVATAVNEAINALPTSATPQDVQDAIDSAVATIEVPPSMTPEEVQEIVDGAVAGITIPESVTSEEVSSAISDAVTGLASTADVTAAVEGAVTTLQEQIAALPAGASPTEVQTAIDTAIAGIEFPAGLTAEDVQSVVDTAVSGITFPEGLSEADVSTIVDTALTGVATTVDMNNAIDAAVKGLNQAIADIPEGMTALEVGEIVDASIASIVFPESVTNEQMSTAISNAIGGIQFPEGLTAEDVAEVVSNSGFATPENVAEAIANAGYVTPEDLGSALSTAGFSTPQDVADAIAAAGYSTPEDVNAAIANAGFSTPEDVAAAIAAAGYSTPEDIANAVANAGYATPEDVAAAIASAGYVNPEDLASALENSGFASADSLATAQEAIDGALTTLETSLLETLSANAQGQTDALTDAEARLLESLSGVEASVLQEMSQTSEGFNQAIADMDVNFSEALAGGLASTQESLLEALSAQGTEQARELTAAEARLLESISGGDAATLRELSSVEGNLTQALADMGVSLTDVQTNLETSISGLAGDVSTGFEAAAEGRQDLADALAALELGQAQALTDAQAALLAEITGGDAATLQELSTVQGALEGELEALGTNIAGVEEGLASDIATLRGDTEEQYNSLQEALAAQSAGQAVALTEAEANLLAEITGGDAALLRELSSVEGGLTEALAGLGTDLTNVSDALAGDITTLQEQTEERFGQVDENIVASEDRMTTLFNQGLESVGGDINALAQQSLDQYGSLQDTLASQAAGQAEALTDTEARLLQNMTGIESSVLQELSTVQGGLENALSDVGMDIEGLAGDVDSRIGDVETAMGSGFAGVAEQFGQVQGDLAGLGAGIAGLGSGLAGVGSGLLSGLGQLGAGQQELQQKISAPKWEDFYSGDISGPRRDFQSAYLGGQPQQSNTVDNLNQMIGRSLEMSPSTQGMFGNFQNKG